MTQTISRPATGRPSARQDIRWQLLDDLCAARADWGLKDRSLQVLRALLSFLPKGERAHLVVFPSNRTLSNRLMGMPDATLRRHLNALCDAGLIVRRMSPNGKRYRIGTSPDLTFGLDLSPFFALAQTIRDTARRAAEDAAERRDLRARIQVRLHNTASDDPRRETIPRLLRRKLDRDALAAVHDSLPEAPALPPETDVAAAQNGCHKQPNHINQSDDEIAHQAIAEIAALGEDTITSVRDLNEVGARTALSLGVSSGWHMAKHQLGPGWAMMALAYLHRRLSRLDHPDRYLLALTRRARMGQFDLIDALRRSGPAPC